ncbi:hypothetical protein HA402_014296 [Bradysia odoriphaga]|nr:hypothetical protein HA402_014296 [Bradysia odoriphaga]
MYPVRVNIAIMCFVGCLITYMLRVNLSITILAMIVPRTATYNNSTSGNGTITIVPDYGPRYSWSPYEESLLLGAYFWGYLFTSAQSGIIAEWVGGRALVGCTFILSSIFTAIGPIVAAMEMFWLLFATRFLVGVFGGPIYPSLHYLIAHWAPPDEKGKFVASLMGSACGTIITWPLVSILIEKFNWSMGFYVPAAFTFITALIWFRLVADSPSSHPRIELQERLYIQQSLAGSLVKQESAFPPMKSVLTSLPFWSLTLLHYGNAWGLFFLMNAAPKYMSEVLKVNLLKAGILSSLPYLARMLFGFVFGAIGDALLRRKLLSKTMIRKSFCIFSHVIPGLLLLTLSYAGSMSSGFVCVSLITLSLGFNGATTVTNLQNSQDLAPNYAGTLYGMINFVGGTTGFITPVVVSYFTAEQSTSEEWKWVFLIGSVFYITPAIVFMIFGSADVQKWNNEIEPNRFNDNIELGPKND